MPLQVFPAAGDRIEGEIGFRTIVGAGRTPRQHRLTLDPKDQSDLFQHQLSMIRSNPDRTASHRGC